MQLPENNKPWFVIIDHVEHVINFKIVPKDLKTLKMMVTSTQESRIPLSICKIHQP